MNTNQIVDPRLHRNHQRADRGDQYSRMVLQPLGTRLSGLFAGSALPAGFTTAPDGKRMSINVETIGGSLMVQHYVETLGKKDHLILDSTSDVFTPSGRTTIHVTWELERRRRWATDNANSPTACSHSVPTNSWRSSRKQGIPFDQFRAQRQPASIAT